MDKIIRAALKDHSVLQKNLSPQHQCKLPVSTRHTFPQKEGDGEEVACAALRANRVRFKVEITEDDGSVS